MCILLLLEYFQSMVGCGTCGYRGLTIISRRLTWSLFVIQSIRPSASGPRHLSSALWHRGADCFGGQLPGNSRDPGQAATATDFLGSLSPCLQLSCFLCAAVDAYLPPMAHFFVTDRTLTGSRRTSSPSTGRDIFTLICASWSSPAI
nr:uncharacterized protein LOC129524583 [Gorilla gorilla gorilla]